MIKRKGLATLSSVRRRWEERRLAMSPEHRLAYLLRRPWQRVETPEDVLSIPTMLSRDELALLYTLARDYASGEGALVDAGCFLGGSSAALLAGVRDRVGGWDGPPVTSYDMFEVEDFTWMKPYFTDEQDLEPGDSFRSVYDRNVARYPGPHEVRSGDIEELGWRGGPIDVLFIDVLKSWEINDSFLRDFLPHVVPGRTVIVHQDYGWGETPWIHITVELMRDSLVWVDSFSHGTHAFFVNRPIPRDILTTSVSDLTFDDKFALMDRAIANNHGDSQAMTIIAKGVLLGWAGKSSEGRSLISALLETSDSDVVQACGHRVVDMIATWPES